MAEYLVDSFPKTIDSLIELMASVPFSPEVADIYSDVLESILKSGDSDITRTGGEMLFNTGVVLSEDRAVEVLKTCAIRDSGARVPSFSTAFELITEHVDLTKRSLEFLAFTITGYRSPASYLEVVLRNPTVNPQRIAQVWVRNVLDGDPNDTVISQSDHELLGVLTERGNPFDGVEFDEVSLRVGALSRLLASWGHPFKSL